MPNGDAMKSRSEESIFLRAKIPIGIALLALGAGGGMFANQATIIPIAERYVDTQIAQHVREERVLYMPRESIDLEFEHIKAQLEEIKSLIRKERK